MLKASWQRGSPRDTMKSCKSAEAPPASHKTLSATSTCATSSSSHPKDVPLRISKKMPYQPRMFMLSPTQPSSDMLPQDSLPLILEEPASYYYLDQGHAALRTEQALVPTSPHSPQESPLPSFLGTLNAEFMD